MAADGRAEQRARAEKALSYSEPGSNMASLASDVIALDDELQEAERVAATLRQALEEIAGCDFDGAAPRMRLIARAALAATGETEAK